ncbi:MAG: hypothetical protein UV61_C0006G0115 [Candidatus Gottesmanbacteria bacterium GW2011_GWB1_43_11]|uniref:N-acetyltransferase domain-containing protein n=1 Tax=Candidatus Gottesmanbacteria bacterium GW2011_GWB1_43_11 TaxID=1618446 RepID=A0A0G1CMZ4_9BACT|nr:MAG: hypothetical protein UV04_C0005G0114 [Candidatus Gottesmanbacteria bacterium GW2011_GWA2_42_16]KKS55700.1 MAG: hypothetical protein UV17_C0008G0051 [Candidatus Gottesmanbacteria bacterium GW2011_GWA1_42_26]KKS81156.1 MAG: hypothetical protein UV55_C0019G0012 [Candidatus Gottesmanbacteria bacterium GW2011_GWC1_43_10]KKS86914.1 MAG: hypothetical protein UV61_C0006G0115 [Candidatus Gottesmanbacteria bacterium GW2011_GWB1_43_11]OGG08261.1 MAG: hypothetical protein A2699_06700 [Candidatus Go
MNNITVSFAQAADVDTMIDWFKTGRELWANEKGEWYSRKALTEWISHSENDILLVAKVNRELAGMCLTHAFYEWAYCEILFVKKEYRRQGIGKLFLEKTVKLLKAKNITLLALQPKVNNKTAQIFYKECGFKAGFHFVWMEKHI